MTSCFFVLERSIEYRPGSPTETHTCDSVRAVPDELRSATEMRPNGLDNFYQKYTEAYGIPVIGRLGLILGLLILFHPKRFAFFLRPFHIFNCTQD